MWDPHGARVVAAGCVQPSQGYCKAIVTTRAAPRGPVRAGSQKPHVATSPKPPAHHLYNLEPNKQVWLTWAACMLPSTSVTTLHNKLNMAITWAILVGLE